MADKHDKKPKDVDIMSGQNDRDDGEWVTVAEAAQRLSRSKRTIRRYIGKGILASKREGRRVFVHMSGQAPAPPRDNRDSLIAELSHKVDTLSTEVEGLRHALANSRQDATVTTIANQQQPTPKSSLSRSDWSWWPRKYRASPLSIAILVSPVLLVMLLGLLVLWVLCSIFWGYVFLLNGG